MSIVTTTLPERMPRPEMVLDKALKNLSWEMRTAMPGIIQAFDSTKQTVTVQVAIREKISINGSLSWETIPLLVDVPIVLPKAGNFVLTMPIKKGDECLVIFQDCCYDAWWQSSGTQNQIDLRRHDLSDGIAILSVWSQPNVISNYSTEKAELRTLDGSTTVSLADDTITLKGTNVVIDSDNVTISGKGFLTHTHSGVEAGTGSTGGVV